MTQKIAILGGGVAGCTAAYWLTHPSQQGRYEVTLYQMGWRLGGKGASGRDPAHAHRNEEHGLHIWFGFYENAFRVLRDAYATTPNGRFATIDDAFTRQSQGIIADIDSPPKHGWDFWVYDFPPQPGAPGDGSALPGIGKIFVRGIEWMAANFDSLLGLGDNAILAPLQDPLKILRAAIPHLHTAEAFALIRGPLTAMRAALHLVIPLDQSWLPGFRERNRLYHILDLGLTALIGLLDQNGLKIRPDRGFEQFDAWEFRAWLRANGAHFSELDAGTIKGLYDLPFAYRDGLSGNAGANLAAGVALRSMLRIFFGYKGAFVFKMNAGMGDTIFVPLYETLKARGVRFEFFHRVENLGLSADGTALADFRVARQAIPIAVGYDPLIDVPGKNLRVWPSAPIAARLQPGTVLPQPHEPSFESAWCAVPPVDTRTFTVGAGRDFDAVVLAIPVGAHRLVAGELIAASPKWARMVEAVKTCRTQCAQLWMKRDVGGLGWSAPGSLEGALVDGYVDDFNTWMDQSVILDTETWPADGPRYLAYFCGPMPNHALEAPFSDPSYPATQTRAVERNMRMWSRHGFRDIWPDVVNASGALDWAEVYHEYYRANIDPSERYVLSVAGSIQHRLHAEESGFAGLFLAGDWTLNGLDAGCVEAAAISGAQAARGISGIPAKIPGESDMAVVT
jgi:uncharacterized protein with NAD-binding domain and iron-sulfur cluster